MLWYISKASTQKLSSLVTSRLLKSDLFLTFYLSVLLHLSLKVKLHLQKHKNVQFTAVINQDTKENTDVECL